MILTSRLLYEFDLRYNRLQSSFDSTVNLVDKLAILNQALRIVYADLVSKAEINSHYRDALKPLEKKEVSYKKLTSASKYDIFETPKDEFRMLRFRAIANKEGCGTKELPILFFQTDDLDNSLISSYWKPDFAWEIAIGDEGAEGYYVWHNSDFSIVSAIGDYYANHPELQCPSMSSDKYYIDWNGKKQTKDVNLILDKDFVFDRIVDIAILIARSIKGDTRDYELQLNKILTTEKINS